MPRTRSPRVAQVRARLVARLQDGVHRPGDRFLSTRGVARHFGVSYQTAHRLLTGLQAEGLLARVEASGTYLAGGRGPARGAQLALDARGRRAGSFGQRLSQTLLRALAASAVPARVRWCDAARRTARLTPATLPIVWDAPAVLGECLAARRSAILVNERPPLGLESVFIDSVSVDDFAGGVYAAQLLRRHDGAGRFAILSGPADDPRSRARVDGCLSRIRAAVIAAPTWYLEGGLAVAARAVAAGPRGIFCANDRLAEAVHRWCTAAGRACPPLVGFDDAPVAEQIGLTTIAIPWEELADAVATLVRRRMADDSITATHVVLSPRPVVRR